MGPLVHPANRDCFTACPSVCPSICPSVRRGFRAFAGERMEGMAWNFTCWCILTIFRTDFSNFSTILTQWNGSNLGFPRISWRKHGGNRLKFCTLMYLDHLQNWLVYGHGLLIFLILALFWLSEAGQIWGFPGVSLRKHGGNGLKFCMLMYLDHLQNWLVYGHGLLKFLILALFWLSETGQILGFRAYPGEHIEGMAWNFACWRILTTFRTDYFRVTVCWFL